MRQAIASNEGGLNELNPVDIHIMTEKKCDTVRAENDLVNYIYVKEIHRIWLVVHLKYVLRG